MFAILFAFALVIAVTIYIGVKIEQRFEAQNNNYTTSFYNNPDVY